MMNMLPSLKMMLGANPDSYFIKVDLDRKVIVPSRRKRSVRIENNVACGDVSCFFLKSLSLSETIKENNKNTGRIAVFILKVNKLCISYQTTSISTFHLDTFSAP